MTPPPTSKFMELQSKMDQIDESIEDMPEDDKKRAKKLHNLSDDDLAPSDEDLKPNKDSGPSKPI